MQFQIHIEKQRESDLSWKWCCCYLFDCCSLSHSRVMQTSATSSNLLEKENSISSSFYQNFFLHQQNSSRNTLQEEGSARNTLPYFVLLLYKYKMPSYCICPYVDRNIWTQGKMAIIWLLVEFFTLSHIKFLYYGIKTKTKRLNETVITIYTYSYMTENCSK